MAIEKQIKNIREGALSDSELESIFGGSGGNNAGKSGGSGTTVESYFYPNFVGMETKESWPPICPNALGLSYCGLCGGNYTSNGMYYCNGHHSRK